MGLFFNVSTKRMHRGDIISEVDKISALKPQEKEYAKAMFERYDKDGLSREEAAKVLHEMATNHKDYLSHDDVEHIRKQVLGFYK